MKSIKLKGHSGCKISLLEDKEKLFVRKVSSNPEYNDRLFTQIRKQKKFKHHLIASPIVFNTFYIEKNLSFDMEFIKGKSFSNFVEKEHHKNIKSIFLKILDFVNQNNFLEETIEQDVEKKVDQLQIDSKYQPFKECCLDFDWNNIHKSYSHGDLTFENIMIKDGDLYFIDFLDSFTSSQVLDYSKLMQDTIVGWSWRKNTTSPFINLLFLHNLMKENLSSNMLTASYKMLILNLLRIIPYCEKEEENFIHSKLLKLKKQKF